MVLVLKAMNSDFRISWNSCPGCVRARRRCSVSQRPAKNRVFNLSANALDLRTRRVRREALRRAAHVDVRRDFRGLRSESSMAAPWATHCAPPVPSTRRCG